MKFVIVCLIVSVLFSSCSTTKTTPLKNKYSTIYSFSGDNDYDKTWSKLIDAVLDAGLPIQLLDKSSGLILCKDVFIGNDLATHETWPKDSLKTLLKNKNAYVVFSRCQIDNGNDKIDLEPSSIIATWAVRVYPDTKLVNVKLINIKVGEANVLKKAKYDIGIDVGDIGCKFVATTTGVLEKKIEAAMKK